MVLAWFRDVQICLVTSLALLAGSCCLPERAALVGEGGVLRLESGYVEAREVGPKGADDRLQRLVRSL